MRWPFVSRRERVRREASEWLARLNGPHGERDRAAFADWYNSSPDRALVYDRLGEQFQAAGRLRHAEGAEAPQRAVARRGRPVRYALAAAAAFAALLAFVFLSARTMVPLAEQQVQIAVFSAEAGDSRHIVLLDGSEVLLSPGSALDVAIGSSERRLRLVRGEARFSVVPDGRPFIVAADATEVVARGTRFVVSLAAGRTTVSLIEGRVDVSYPPLSGSSEQRRLARLGPGEQLVVEARHEPSAVRPDDTRSRPPRRDMLEFDETPLGEAVEQANRHGRPRIRLGDPALAALRVTGAFRAGDTRGLSESVATAFGLEIERAPDGTLVLHTRPAVAQAD